MQMIHCEEECPGKIIKATVFTYIICSMEVMDKRGKSTQFLKLQSTTSYILHENEFKIDHIMCVIVYYCPYHLF